MMPWHIVVEFKQVSYWRRKNGNTKHTKKKYVVEWERNEMNSIEKKERKICINESSLQMI